MEFRVFSVTIFLIYFASTSGSPASLIRSLQQNRNEDHPSILFMENPKTRELELVDLHAQEIEYRAVKSDVFYFLHTKNNIHGVEIRSVKDTIGVFDKTKPTIFITHGWNNDHESAVGTLIRTAVLSKYDINVFCVDWGIVANKNYLTAKSSVNEIGSFIAEFVTELTNHYETDLSSVTLIGHSLGAHISGNIGADLSGGIAHIIGLDPAGPLFSLANIDNRLDASDGVFVEVIHTCGYLLGFYSAIGDADYFPNGGYSQPGCGLDLAGTCAHSRAYQYFAESIYSNDGFVSYECSNMDSFEEGLCYDNPKSTMGNIFNKKPNGSYYLTTNSAEPFAKGHAI